MESNNLEMEERNSGIALAFYRKRNMTGVELACYWFGISFFLTFLIGIFFAMIRLFSKYDEWESLGWGVFIGLLISLISGIIILVIRNRRFRNLSKDKIRPIETH